MKQGSTLTCCLPTHMHIRWMFCQMFRGADTPEDVQRVAKLDAGSIDYLGVDFFSEVFLGLYHDAHGNEVTRSRKLQFLCCFFPFRSCFRSGCLAYFVCCVFALIVQSPRRWNTFWPSVLSLISLDPFPPPAPSAALCAHPRFGGPAHGTQIEAETYTLAACQNKYPNPDDLWYYTPRVHAKARGWTIPE